MNRCLIVFEEKTFCEESVFLLRLRHPRKSVYGFSINQLLIEECFPSRVRSHPTE